MELDKRSCHFIVTVPKDCQPVESDIPILKADVVIAKWSDKNKSLSVWYSWTNAQRPSTITNGWNADDIVLKHTKLDKRSTFMEVEHDWLFAPQLTSSAIQVTKSAAAATEDDEDRPSTVETTLLKAIRKYKTAKRKWYLVDAEHTDLINQYNELLAKLETTDNAINELNKIGDAVKKAKTEVDKLMELEE